MSEVYTSAEVASQLGCTQEVIRAKKSRHSDRFAEGQHFIRGENNRTLWTVEGVTLLQELVGVTSEVTSDITPAVTNNVTPAVTDNDSQQETQSSAQQGTITDLILNGLVEDTANSLAVEFYRRLPAAVMRHVKRMNQSPTAHERETVKQQLKFADLSTVSLALTGLPGV